MVETRNIDELRQRIVDYRRLRGLTPDKEFIQGIDRILAKAEVELKRLDAEALTALNAEHAGVRAA